MVPKAFHNEKYLCDSWQNWPVGWVCLYKSPCSALCDLGFGFAATHKLNLHYRSCQVCARLSVQRIQHTWTVILIVTKSKIYIFLIFLKSIDTVEWHRWIIHTATWLVTIIYLTSLKESQGNKQTYLMWIKEKL